MKSLKIIVFLVACFFLSHYSIFHPVASAQESPGESIDCTDVSIDFSDDQNLTRAERLRLMDKAFMESLNKFELCRQATEEAEKRGDASGAGKGTGKREGDGAASGSAEKTGQNEETSTSQSVATSTMSGTEPAKEPSAAESVEVVEPGPLQGSQNTKKTGRRNSGTVAMSNGKLPEDIPTADNDDALAAQIRYAAENETDPIKKEQLWNEYRKYKGLAPK